MVCKLLVFQLLALATFADVCWSWGYGPLDGPDTWVTSFPTCGFSKQSPINLQSQGSNLDPLLEPVTMIGYNTLPPGARFLMLNTGHSVQVDLSNYPADITHSTLANPYVLDQFYFHWGSDNLHGSEHRFGAVPNAMEIQLLHHSDIYPTWEEASTQPDGLVMLSIQVVVGAENPVLNDIVSKLQQIAYAQNAIEVTAFRMLDLVPSNLDDFWRYDGSMTWPPCEQTVDWFVYNSPITISQVQLDTFRTELYATEFGALPRVQLVDNYRDPQPLNSRQVLRSFNPQM